MRFIFGAVGVISLFCLPCGAVDWRPIDPAELAQKTPKVDPAADAEAIFWDVRIEDRVLGDDLSLVMTHYIRIKIFTEHGKEQYATVEIPRSGKRSITEVAARTIKADGSIVEMTKDSIFDRELLKTKGVKVKGKTFALPNVEVGDIIEYRYREIRGGELSAHMRLYFQREIPMWNVTYHLKPLSFPGFSFGMRSMAFQCEHPPFTKESGTGFFQTSLNNMPAFREEPSMPPQDQLRAWMLIYYEEDRKLDAEKFWRETGKSDYARYKPMLKADGDVKSTALELVTGLDKPEDKLAALDTFCRTKIRNLNSGAFHVSSDDRKSLKENHNASETMKQKAGTSVDVDILFAAMAKAIGFDARIARMPNRGDFFFTSKMATTYFINGVSVAVEVGDKWVFYDPSSSYLERGMLRWQEEGTLALISDPKEGFFKPTQSSASVRSLKERRANLKLSTDGTLEGTVQYRYTGHVARDTKFEYEETTTAQQEEEWKDTLKARLSTAEVSDFEIQDASDPAKPMLIRHKVSIAGYGTGTGKRILLQPAFFQRNIGPRFTAKDRKWDLYFPYSWAEDDEVTIELPDGWVLDQPFAPHSSKLGSVGEYTTELLKSNDGRKLIYKRKFTWGVGGDVMIPAAAYGQVRKAFDFIQEQDAHSVTLKAVSGGQ